MVVVPVMVDQPDRNERAYWQERDRDPDLQARRLEQLGDLAIRRPWDLHRRRQFKDRVHQLRAEQSDAKGILDAYGITRQVLAQEQNIERPPGVDRVDVIAAYSSGKALREDFVLHDAKERKSAQALLLRRRLAIPAQRDPEDSLRAAIALSRDTDFKEKRRDLFEWQAQSSELTPADAVDRISDLAQQYNTRVKEASSTVRWRFAFTISGIALGFATGGLGAAAAAAALSLVQFATLDRKPAVDAGTAQPVAMFHDIRERVGLSLR